VSDQTVELRRSRAQDASAMVLSSLPGVDLLVFGKEL
jgi:hypothetical protein